jgi:hypothetical protein
MCASWELEDKADLLDFHLVAFQSDSRYRDVMSCRCRIVLNALKRCTWAVLQDLEDEDRSVIMELNNLASQGRSIEPENLTMLKSRWSDDTMWA